jgi:hypothetical protein
MMGSGPAADSEIQALPFDVALGAMRSSAVTWVDADAASTRHGRVRYPGRVELELEGAQPLLGLGGVPDAGATSSGEVLPECGEELRRDLTCSPSHAGLRRVACCHGPGKLVVAGSSASAFLLLSAA